MVDTVRCSILGGVAVQADTVKEFQNGATLHQWADGCRYYLPKDGRGAANVECSLPKLLFGSSGRCITNQQHLDEAWEKLASRVHPGILFEPSRVDLCWNYDIEPARVIGSLRLFRLPGQRKPTVHWDNETCYFHLPNDVLIRFYDKGREMGTPDVRMLRVEVQARWKRTEEQVRAEKEFKAGKAARELHFSHSRSQWFASSFLRMRERFLSFMALFDTGNGRTVSHWSKFVEFLMGLQEMGISIDGLSPIDFYVSGVTDRHARKLRAEINSILPERRTFAFLQNLT